MIVHIAWAVYNHLVSLPYLPLKNAEVQPMRSLKKVLSALLMCALALAMFLPSALAEAAP